ncbi:hypothetical protein A3H10_04790 [Candidatus Uhrbacteria bacterium RIFCSPLOWO2_12_FULL_46_10]|uniref:Uncharacterized protein n=1 Tax=Candidatus Uhrbacteria bacterium RIFCSPLOWO2_01_FULL_47_25 TaxID=1802402 RepID=A0A1F7UW32_9BACT|nr:MAG: hypothetical protein A2752_00895 [Candidatus Uhrbacteria bacterium RIFCSPHIGHO2_01_FULL_46_23]OGL69869.1 MAG: hypothetical protein A3D60_00785 [Candidatus Uhrbacteria bacterium RIFCSPHIGHO2_02_FULL_47_29]OGL75650.1 MAG: hypothetical protein A3E96_01270 [Candidatus Uhrbacteria bacterium RIFCSPHIGHO2_12_FULL_46_13]OGL82466.1 MAG: hypothetical protein A2936_02055 [Candidatus Uhrbacteria bacterium RIFCSPLOWO2_01_FULL_47_25]OGL85244.1 MAG: hypothetical protein A3I37_02855 [Candidatus Uhrbact
MIPIVSITDLINGIIAAAIAVRLAFMLRPVPPAQGGLVRWYDSNKQNGLLEFIGFYLFFALFWLLFATPELIFQDVFSITIAAIIGYLFLFISLAFVIQIPFIFFERRWLGMVLGVLIMTLALAFLIGRIIDPALDKQEIIPPYVFWSEAYSPWIRFFPGIAGLVAAGTFTITFVYIAWYAAPRWHVEGKTRIYRAAVCLGGGMTLLLVAAIMFFILSRGGFLVSVVTSSLCIAGLLVMLRGIKYMHEERKYQIDNPS